MTDAQKLIAIQKLIDTDGRFMTDGEVVDGIVGLLEEKRDIDTRLDEALKQVFLDDCTEILGLTACETDEAWEKFGEEFVVGELEELWNGWGNNFPNVTGD